MRLAGVGLAQLRDGVFAKVGQGALRQLALETFQPHPRAVACATTSPARPAASAGSSSAASRASTSCCASCCSRSSRWCCSWRWSGVILLFAFDVWYLVVVAITIAIYVWFTFKVTEWRVQVRSADERARHRRQPEGDRQPAELRDGQVFRRRGARGARYDASMQGYETAAIETQISLAWLNFGQSFIITIGLVIVMAMAAVGVQAGTLTVGDFVMVNAYMIQITLPLDFLGTVYREIRQSLVDMARDVRPARAARRGGRPPGREAARVSTAAGWSSSDVSFSYDTERAILKGVNLVRRTGPDRRGGRPVRLGQVDHRPAAVPLLRRHRRRDPIDGQDIRDVTQDSPARGDRHGAAGHRAVQRHHLLQHRLRPPRRHPRRGRGGGPRGVDPRLHRQPARRLRRRWSASAG